MFIFAIKTLLHNRGKFLIALVGVVFAQVLMNLQCGMFLGLIRKASIVIDNCDADIWVGHYGVENSDISADIPEHWVNRIRGLAGVSRAEPYIVSAAPMKLKDGDFEGVMIVGSEPSSMLGSAWSFTHGSREDLRQQDAISFDELDAPRLAYPKVGDVSEINGRRARIVAKTRGILGFITTPYVFTNLESARRYLRIPSGYCSFLLVQAKEHVDLDRLSERIRQRIPDADVYTSDAFSRKSRFYWATRTGISMSFGGSTVLGLIVGLVVVAQSLYTLVLDHLPDYATLKAIGATEGEIYLVLLVQGLTIAGLGCACGVGTSWALQRMLSSPLTPIEIPIWLQLASVTLATLICIVSSVLPWRRIHREDPVSVLQA